MRRPFVALLATAGLLSTAPAAQAVFPAVGGPHETFVVRFVAPNLATPGRFYSFDARGPAGCGFVSTITDLRYAPGDPVAIVFSPFWVFDADRNWCPGRYVGHIDFWGPRAFDAPTRRVASGIVFRVKRGARPARRFSFYPRTGLPNETFVVRFRAPLATRRPEAEGVGGEGSTYVFRARGPAPCRRLETGWWDGADERRGDPGVLDIAVSRTVGIGARERWCPGRYVGQVQYVTGTESEHTVVRSVGPKVRFRVVRRSQSRDG
jgi:hypothetical protein